MKLRSFLPFIVLLLFIYVMVSLTGMQDLFSLLKNSNPLFLLFASLSSFASLLFFTLSWQFIFFALREEIPFKNLLVTFIVGIFSSAINPVGRVGSEGIKLLLLNRKDGISLEKSTTSILLKDMLGFLVIAFLLGFFFFLLSVFNEKSILARYALWGMVVMVAGMCTCLLALSGKGGRLSVFLLTPFFRMGKRVSKRFALLEDRMKSFLFRLQSSFALARRNPSCILFSLILCLGGWGFLFLTARLVCFTLALQLPLPLLCLSIILAEIASLLPLPAGTSGTDIALTFLYNISGLPLEAAFAAAMMGRFLAFYLPMMTGGIISFFLSFPKGEPSKK